jgi:uncharacterized protein YihD (DUF1040 family)
MAKPRIQTAAPDPPPVPQVGDKVRPGRSEMVYEISHVSKEGDEVNLHVRGTNLQRFRVPVSDLTFVERKAPARTANPFTNPEPTLDIAEMLEKIATVQQENLQRLDDDIEILTKYLKAEDAPKAAISILEGMSTKQHDSWKTAVERIEELLASGSV